MKTTPYVIFDDIRHSWSQEDYIVTSHAMSY